MRQVIQELYKKFSGSDVFIIGGGNSLKHFDFSKLENKNVIALNSAYKYVGDSAVIYWADATWGATNSDKGLSAHPSKYKFTSRLNADTAIQQNKRGDADAYYLKRTGDYGFDPNVNNVRGNNSGAHAINFAVNLNAYRILLLGFDMGYVAGKTHFHNEHVTATAASTYTELFIPSIESMAKEIKHRPVEIINCFSESKLKCFKFGNVKDYL